MAAATSCRLHQLVTCDFTSFITLFQDRFEGENVMVCAVEFVYGSTDFRAAYSGSQIRGARSVSQGLTYSATGDPNRFGKNGRF